uniref:Uncharacterized protein n=1 Tax=Trichogramma kaykai TaxID=54128 RepID=A0ABD2W6L1_9HYME
MRENEQADLQLPTIKPHRSMILLVILMNRYVTSYNCFILVLYSRGFSKLLGLFTCFCVTSFARTFLWNSIDYLHFKIN